MLKTFVTSEDEQGNIIFLTALFCSNPDEQQNPLSDCFHLILQAFYMEKVLEAQPILDWITSAKAKVSMEQNAEESTANSSAKQADVEEDSHSYG